LPAGLLEDECGAALFGILVEGLADRFDPALCDVYAELFSQALRADRTRYQRVRQIRPVDWEPRRVLVLSRVTLGADIAVTSVLMSAARRRFPDAEILFAGPLKNYELFAGDTRIRHARVEYRRGSLSDRLAVVNELRELAAPPDTLVLDPDSRLTQLGLLAVCAEERYRFFESRAYRADTVSALPELAAQWCEETMGVTGAKPFVALSETPLPGPYIAISLGVGGNPAKRIADPFEDQLLRKLSQTGLELYIDRGAGGEEAERVTRAVERSGAGAKFWEGSFAGFARIIAGARLYVGYDSAGQHVAAASGIPLICIFTGFPVPRMFDRWRPVDKHATVLRVDHVDPQQVLAQVDAALPLH
jgi:ADP-heptose:LPS heptosyltransferase